MAIPEETFDWNSDLTLIWKEKGKVRAASPSSSGGEPTRTTMTPPPVRSCRQMCCVCARACVCAGTQVRWRPHSVAWLLWILVFIASCPPCVSRSRRCEGTACYSCPRTLAGAHRFRSPCRRCAGSAERPRMRQNHGGGGRKVGETNRRRATHTLTQLTDEKGTQSGFLVVVLNVYVDHVHGLHGFLLSRVQIWEKRQDHLEKAFKRRDSSSPWIRESSPSSTWS